jgi:DNA ligase-1
MITGDKSAREKLEAAYNVRPDVGWLTEQVKIQIDRRKGLSISVTPQLGVPIMPALCQRLPAAEEIVEKMRQVAVEPKWDGQRIQAHAWILGTRDKGQGTREIGTVVKLFTRSLEDVSEMFPDLVHALKKLLSPLSLSPYPLALILDGEAVAVDPKTGRILPFQTMITRKRKYGIQKKLADVPVKYMVFDILYLNGKSLINEEFIKRRRILERSLLSSYDIIQLAPQIVTSDPGEIREFLKQQIDAGLEGIVAKRTDAPYIPGRTQFAWVKLKWEGAAKSGGLVYTVD